MTIDYDRLREMSNNASPSPWTVKDDDYGEVIVANESGHDMTWGDQVRFEMYAGDKNVDPHLVALAPDMAKELLRLRDELTSLRNLMWTHAGYLRKDMFHTAADWTEDHALRLDRIMKGDAE